MGRFFLCGSRQLRLSEHFVTASA